MAHHLPGGTCVYKRAFLCAHATMRGMKALAIIAAALVLVSFVFPAAAGLSKHPESFPVWWGPADVSLSLLVGVLAVIVLAMSRGQTDQYSEFASYRVYRVLIHGILIVCALVIYSGEWIVWPQCATGFLWRFWLLAYALPMWIMVVRHR
jgi:hypothetical protein